MLNDINKIEHEQYKQCLKDSDFRKTVIKNNEKSLSILDDFIENIQSKDIKQLKIFKNLKHNISKQYYINIYQLSTATKFELIDKEFDCILDFVIVGYGTEAISINLVNSYSYIIEVEKMHSFAKNKGIKIIKQLQKLANKSGVPIALYDQNTKSKDYYNNMRFSDTTRRGYKDDIYKVYYPKGFKILNTWIGF